MYLANHMLGSQRNGVNHVSMNLGDFDRVAGPVRAMKYPIYLDALLGWYKTKSVKSIRLMFTWEAVQAKLKGTVPPSEPEFGTGYDNYWTDLTDVITRLVRMCGARLCAEDAPCALAAHAGARSQCTVDHEAFGASAMFTTAIGPTNAVALCGKAGCVRA